MSVCPRCGTSFSCGMVDPITTEPCWCTALPALPAQSKDEPPANICLCPACLRAQIDAAETEKP